MPPRSRASAGRGDDRGGADGRELMAGRAPSAPAVSQAVSAAWNRGEFVIDPGAARFSLVLWLETVGSGKVGNPCARRQRATFKANATSAAGRCGVPRRRRSAAGACRRSGGRQRRLLRLMPMRDERREVPLAVGVGEVRHAVRAHAPREGERRRLSAPAVAVGRGGALLRGRRWSRAAPRTRRRAAACGHEQRQAGQRGGTSSARDSVGVHALDDRSAR